MVIYRNRFLGAVSIKIETKVNSTCTFHLHFLSLKMAQGFLPLIDHREGVSGWEHIKLRGRAAIPLEMLSGGGFPQSRA